jgi:hypothetical protein
MPLLRWLVGGFSRKRPEFDFRPVHAGFVMDKVAKGQKFLRVLRCFQFTLFHGRYVLINLLPSRYNLSNWQCCRSQWPRGLRRMSAASRLLRLWVRIPAGAWMSLCCYWCVLSGRGLCYGPIICLEESYRLWCVVLCDLATSWMRRLWPTGGLLRQNRTKQTN